MYAKTRNIGELMKHFTAIYPQNAQEVSLTVQRCAKMGVAPSVLTTQQLEIQTLTSASQLLQELQGAPVTIITAEATQHAKKTSAQPGKPSVVVE
jgi:hypothetical protein